MKLKQFLKLTKKKQSEFAKEINVTPSMITQMLQGKKHPSLQLAKKIDKRTNGIVSFSDLS